MQKFVISAAALVVAAGAASAKTDIMAGVSNLKQLASGGSGAFFGNDGQRGGFVTTGFEAPDYAVGALEPQQGWVGLDTLFGLPDGGFISNANPAAGSQHVRNSRAAGSAGSFNGTFQGVTGTGATSTSIKVYLPAAAYADYFVTGFDAGTGNFAWGVRFSYTGVVRSQGATSGGAPIVYNQYVDLATSYDANTGAFSINYNGANIFTGTNGFANRVFNSVLLGSDNFHLTGENGDFDNFSHVPTPGAAGLLGLGAVAGLRRRR